MIIGVSGKLGSGKDTVGNIIQYLTSQTMGISTLNKTIPTSETMTYNEWSKFFRTPRTLKSDWEIKKFAYKLKQIVSILTGISVEDLEKQEVKDRLLGEEWSQEAQWNGKECHNCGSDGNTYVMPNNPTVRNLLQVVGTEAMRDTIHENVWVNALFADCYHHGYITSNTRIGIIGLPKEEWIEIEGTAEDKRTFPNWIITDLRFPNELKAVEDRKGVTIRVSRTSKSEFISAKVRAGRSYDASNYPDIQRSEHPSETALDDAKFKYTIINNGTIEELVEAVKQILITENII